MSEKAAVREVGFTPGPWTAGRPDMATIVDGYDSKWIYSDAGGKTRYVAVASGMEAESWAEVMANARLIAAAPEMYEALLEAEAALDMGLRMLPAKIRGWDNNSVAQGLRIVRAALLKARGSNAGPREGNE